MIILRLFLYLVCAVSVGWSGLVLAGPPVIKRLISVYSDGALTPYGVTVSPRLGIGISRLEFNVKNEIEGWDLEGFSRATEIAWSLIGEKPFIEINIGPSVVKNYVSADSIKFYTPSFKEIDWKNISIVAKIESAVFNSSAKIHSVILDGDVNIESAKVSDVNIRAEEFSATNGNSNYTVRLIKNDFSELNLNANLVEQLLSSSYKIEDIRISEPNFTASKAIVGVWMTESARNLKIKANDLKLPEFDGYIHNLTVDGSFTQSNVLQDLQIVSVNGFFSKKLPKFREISASVKKSGNERYKAIIEGKLEEFELSDSDNFIGLIPASNFVIDLEMDRTVPAVTSTSKINFTTLDSADVFGFVEMGFTSEFLRNLECEFLNCDLSDFDFFYKINFDDEWVEGSASCPNSLCGIAEMDHVVRTSNTINVFTILNRASILNPLSSLLLFGAISNGQKINDGHELKFQF